MYDFKGKKVLVAGGTGLIGIPLVELLLQEGASVRVASLDDPSRAHPETEFFQLDLTDFENCLKACGGVEYVFNLLCIKGSPQMAKERPVDMFEPHILFNVNLLKAARQSGAGGFLYTSTYGIYPHTEVSHEDSAFTQLPSENDLFAGWAKLTGEIQARAYRAQYGWDRISVVRPANTYGPYDNFESVGAMVVPSLIRRAVSGENPLVVWGDGSQIRDFIHARDVARGMLHVAKLGYSEPVNLGSGKGVTIKELAETVRRSIDPMPKLEWDTTKPTDR